MSTENLNECISHQICHNDDALEHIDDESQQEYVEKMAPKAEEELLIINQDSSPVDEINEHKIEEISNAQNTLNIEQRNDESLFTENELLDETANNEHLEETFEKDIHSDVYNLLVETQTNIEATEQKLELNSEVEIYEPKAAEDVEHTDETEASVEVIRESEASVEESEFSNAHIEETKTTIEPIEEPKIDNNLVSEEACVNDECTDKPEQSEETDRAEQIDIENTDEQESKKKSVVIEFKDEVNLSEELKINIHCSKVDEKPLDNKKAKDVKALSSSYSNDDNVNSDCEICKKTVYPLEKLSANDRIFHKQCFRCSKCRCALLAGNFSFNNDKPYCRPHYIELFKKRGRYDEIDDSETAQQTTINDILTDELPAQDITKNLLAKFRDLESGAGSITSVPTANADGTDEMPAPNTTKNLMERFSALGKDSDRDQKRKPMIEIPRTGENGACENQPISLPKDVARANDPSRDELPEQGITKNLVNRFRDLESTGVTSK